MTEQHEASKAPAPAVEAEQGASQGEHAQSHTTPSAPDATAASSESSSNVATPAAVTASGQEATSAAPADDAAASSDDAADAGEEGEETEGESEGGEASASADPAKKKRRRRRRKKPGAKDANGMAVEGAVAEGAAAVPHERSERPERGERGERGEKGERPQREGAGGVFSRFFDSGPNAGKRHAFSAGEVVAGRVIRVNDGAFVVDLFGKATAFVDIFEPHEVPALPEPPAPVLVQAAPAVAPSASTEAAPSNESTSSEPTSAEATGEQTAAAAIAESALGVQPVEDAPIDAPQAEVEPAAIQAPAEPAAVDPVAASPEVEAAAGADGATGPGDAQTYGATVAESAFGADAGAGSEELSSNGAEAEAAEHHDEAHAEAEHHDDAGHEESEAEPEPAPPPPPALGTIFRGRIGSVAESGHVVLVNRIIDTQAAKQRIVKAREQRQRVRGVVYGFNRGGFDVLVEGVRVFCPASGMALGPVENPETVLGQRLEFTVPPAKAGTHGLVVSRRGILERQQRKQAKQLFRSLTPGQKLKGRVTQVREFGLFVDLGGFEGLVHQSELSFNRGVRPQDVAQPGDEVEVQVLRVGEGQTRKERERVSLSMKTLLADPWSEHKELLEPGNIVTGKVVRTTEFGAFVELAPSIEGLLHISELGRELKHANQAIEEGATIRVIVERVDRGARRISLSKLSAAEEKALDSGVDPKSGKAPKPGQHLTVVVEKVEHHGLLVQIPGVFGRRGRGFIPNAEMGTERGTDHRRGFPPGTNVPVKVVGVDRDGGFRFSRKAVTFEEEKKAVQDYRREAARHGLGTFGDLLRAKLEGTKPNS
ncbi:MAG: ribosomal protein S1p [Myxococcaceae bacterium]|nr:ribosomal protein S1p [Myxococcaceae bacterium]